MYPNRFRAFQSGAIPDASPRIFHSIRFLKPHKSVMDARGFFYKLEQYNSYKTCNAILNIKSDYYDTN